MRLCRTARDALSRNSCGGTYESSPGTEIGGRSEQAQHFLSAHAVFYSLFNVQRDLVSAAFYRLRRARAFECWSAAVAA
jgi:hypothetical protein